MNKNRIILAFLLLVACVFTLVGCSKGSEVVVDRVYVNKLDTLVHTVDDTKLDTFGKTLGEDGEILAGLQVMLYMSDRTILTKGIDDISSIVDKNSGLSTSRVTFDTTEDKLVDDDNIKKGLVRTYYFSIGGQEFPTPLRVFLKGSESSGNKTVLLQVTVELEYMTHIFGETFNYKKYLSDNPSSIIGRKVDSSGVISNVTGDLEFVSTDPRNTNDARYKGGRYDIFGTYDDLAVVIPIHVNGGEVPIHSLENPGWVDVIGTQPLGYLMSWVSIGGIFAVGIVFTTIIVRTLAWPIYASTNNMSLKMKLAGPDIQKLERKYANRTDRESMQRKQVEMMQIYKKHKINFFGCITPIIQFPIFTAMWQLVRRAMAPGGMFADKITNSFLFGIDLHADSNSWTSPAHLILVILVGATMVLLTILGQKQPEYMKNTATHQPKNEKQAQQEKTMKMMTYMMTAMMVVFAFTSNNAMSFYWIIGNIYSIGQNLFMKWLNKRKFEKQQPLDLI